MRKGRSEPLILNVNDNEAARYMVTLMLRRAGFLVVEAGTGLGALDKVTQCKPDLVILDVKLPDVSGLEICRRIRSNPETASTKVLHTSATYVTVDKKVQSLEGGADGYLAQPFEAEELIATVHSLLRLNQTEHELREHAQQLKEADRRKNEFLSMLAHELRNPLAAISASLPLIARRPPMDDTERRARDVLSRQTSNLGRLIDDLLDVARVTQGKIEVKWGVLSLCQLLRRVADSALETKISARRQHLELQLGDDPVYVRGDATRLEQVFTNLLDNASKYTDAGGSIRLSLQTLRDGPKPMAQVDVSDDGIGMSSDTLPSIFDLFSQADVPIARSRGGLGIGLTLVQTLVQLHGGEVEAESEGLGRGSRFAVRLPLLAPAEAQLHERVSRATNAPDETRRRVLLVEDNLDAQQMLADLMGLWGHEVTCASDGTEGVAKALELLPDMALIDLGLPGIDGYEVARQLRRDPRGKSLKLIALTGYGSPEQKARSLAVGFDLHLVKPVDATRLAALLADPTRS